MINLDLNLGNLSLPFLESILDCFIQRQVAVPGVVLQKYVFEKRKNIDLVVGFE